METPVTSEHGEEMVSGGPEIMRQTEERPNVEAEVGLVEERGSVVELGPIAEKHPVVEEGEVVEGDSSLTVEEGEDAAMSLVSPLSLNSDFSPSLYSTRISSSTSERSPHEDYSCHGLQKLPSTNPDDIVQENLSGPASISKESIQSNSPSLTQGWDLDYQSREIDSCHGESVA